MNGDTTGTRAFLLDLAKGHWGRLCLGVVLTVLGSSLALPLAWLVRQAFDTWLPEGDFDSLLKVGLAILVLRIINAALTISTRLLNVKTTEDMTCRIREILNRRLFRVERAELDQAKTGHIHDLVVTESHRFHSMLSYLVGMVFPSAVKMCGLTLVLAYISWRLLAIMIVVWPILWLMNEALRRHLVKKVRTARAAFRNYSGAVIERVRLLNLIKYENEEDRERRTVDDHVERVASANRPVEILDVSYLEVQGIVLTVISVAVLVAGSHEVTRGRMTMGDFVSFYMVVSLLNQALREFAAGLYQVLVGRESLEKILSWFQSEDRTHYSGEQSLVPETELCLKGVDFSYVPEEPLLWSIDLSLKRGETAVLLGPNGCGKSTLIWLLLGLYRPNSGFLQADGVNYEVLNMGHLRASIGFVPQEALLLDASIHDNVAYGAKEASENEVLKALDMAGAKDWVASLPEGLQTKVGPQGGLLSGGQRQRISLARALLKRPTFLFFDEPTNHLDEASVCEFLTTIQSLEPAPGILIITHDQSLRQVADQVYNLSDGKLRLATEVVHNS